MVRNAGWARHAIGTGVFVPHQPIRHYDGQAGEGIGELDPVEMQFAHWLWDNQDKLRAIGISLAPVQPAPDR